MCNQQVFRFSRLRRAVAVAVAICVFGGAFSTPCRAQQGKGIAEGLLKALIESQLEKARRRNGGNLSDPFRPADGRGNLRPQSLTPQMQKLRPIAASFNQETATLRALLQKDARRSVEARRRLPDIIRLQAAATALSQRASRENHHGTVMGDFRSLNQNWSSLSHQLGQCRALSNQTTTCMKRLSALDAQYCSLLGIQEQFNSQELVRAAYTLTTYVADLIDDVQAQPLPRNRSRKLMHDLSGVSRESEYFAGLVSQGAPYQTVVAEYQDAYKGWAATEGALSTLSGHSVARSLRRIRDSHQTIHQILRLQMGIDKTQILHLIHELDAHATDVFRSLTLHQMMALPDSGAVPDAADAFYGTIQNIDDHVHRDESPQAIGEAWVYADEAWNQFSYYLSPIQSGTVPVQLREIGAMMRSIQQMLGVTVQYDRNALVRSASSLENLSEHLETTLRRWQTHRGNHDRTLVTKAAKMVDLFHHIEQAVGSGDHAGHHLSDCDEAIALWQQIRPALKTCDTDQRPQFDHIVATFTPELVRLRTMLDE